MRILIAEDEKVSRRILAAALTGMGHDVIQAENGREAWEKLRREDVRLVIADWEMPEMDGVELVRKIRESDDQGYVYTILLTSRGHKNDIVSGLDAGADDYITKPFDRDELMVRIKAGERVIRLETELAERNEQLRRMALVDGLTGIANRRSFEEDFRRLCDHARRFTRPFTVLMLDIDFFKKYNDGLGHEAGDNALRLVAQSLQQALRTTDKAYRYGGEEFICLLPETDAEGGLIVAERLRCAVEGLEIPHPDNPWRNIVTVSVGLASCTPGAISAVDDVQREADQALYQAKAAGRNRVVVFHQACPTT